MKKIHDIEEVLTLYKNGMSSIEIAQTYATRGVTVTPRHIQRIVKQAGIIRPIGEAFRNAMKRGRVTFVRKEWKSRAKRKGLPPTLRYKILERDGFKCQLCGATAQTAMLEVDHIDNNPANHEESNLRVLCHECNFGRPSLNRKSA